VKPWKLPWFALTYAYDLVRANAVVAYEVVTPTYKLTPAVIAVDVGVRGWRLGLLANLVTLTPGTLTLDVSDDSSILYVHTLHLEDPLTTRDEVLALQARIVEVFGP
jgi:multicomponent Na+:H+ antiporter subunit E